MASAAPKKISFNRDVRAILSENCYTCHGPDAAARKAKLRLDKREAAVAENKDGLFAIKPGDVEDSELIYRIFAKDADELMPPKESKLALTAEQKAILKQWVAEGAEYEPHWAYEKPKREAVPVVKNSQWSRNDVDRFILAQLEKRGWKPSKVADKQALIRRVSLDLTGLPPTPVEVAAFVADTSPDAYEKLVDRLLAKPAYGEHWARQWLDLARYADSTGYADDQPRTIWGIAIGLFARLTAICRLINSRANNWRAICSINRPMISLSPLRFIVTRRRTTKAVQPMRSFATWRWSIA